MPKDRYLTIRMSEAELEEIKEKSAQKGYKTTSSYVREIISRTCAFARTTKKVSGEG